MTTKSLAMTLALGAGLAMLSGCGGGDTASDARADHSAWARAQALAAGDGTAPAAARVNLWQVPVPAGTVRVFQRAVVDSSEPGDRSAALRAEDMLAAFDASQVPVYIVACDSVRQVGVNLGPAARPFLMVLDVRTDDLPFATGQGYAPLTAEAAAELDVVREGRCSPDGPTISAEQRIHGLARRNFPAMFSGWSFGGTQDGYRYRYYASTRNTLGLVGNDVFVQTGLDGDRQPVGKVWDFIPSIDGLPVAQFAKPVPQGAKRMVLRARVGYDFSHPPSELDFYGTSEWAENLVSGFDARRVPVNIVACDHYSGPGGPANAVDMAMVLDVREVDLGYARGLGFVPLTAHEPLILYQNPWACSPQSAPAITPERRIFGLSRRLHAQTFVGLVAWGRHEEYVYQYYGASRNYLGVAGDRVYVHDGRDLNFQFVGTIRDFIPTLDGIPGSAGSSGQ